MSDGLKAQHRTANIATLAANDRVEQAVLFGSRAMGTNTVTSDVDIALFGQQLTLTDQASLAAASEDLPMAQSLDLVLHSTIDNPALVEHIRSHGVEWYRRGGGKTGSSEGVVGAHREWQVVKLEELASDEPGSIAIGPFGSRMKSDVYTPFGVPVIRGTNISASRAWKNSWVYVSNDFADSLPNCNACEGDLVFPHRGSIGEVAIVPNDKPRYMISTSLMKFRPDPEKASSLFLFYYFRSSFGRNEIMKYSSQVGTPGIGQPLTSLRQFQVVVPPREDQERVAEILSVLDDKIELNRQMNETLEAMAKALFKSWFVDFDPVRAKVEGQPTGLPDEISALFPDSFEDSELGEIPRGWGISEIGKEVDAVGGATPSTKEPAYWEGGEHHWTTPKDLSKLSSPVLLDTDRKVTNAGVGKISSGLLPVGTVLLSSRAPIGYLAITAIPTAVNQGFIAMLCKKRLPNIFVLLWCHENLDYIKGISGGSTFAEISKKAFRPISVIVPSGDVLSAYESLLRPFYDSIVTNMRESKWLTRIRELLLPRLMSGEICLSENRRVVGGVV